MNDIARKSVTRDFVDASGRELQLGESGARLRVAKPTSLTTVGLYKSYHKGNVEVPVLRGVDLCIPEGQLTAIVGQSGSGKSTLLHLLGTLDKPDKGEIWYGDIRLDQLSARQRDQMRNRDIGMIFQFYHLLPELTTLENVLIPKMIELGMWRYRAQKEKWTERATSLLDTVGLSHRLKHRPGELSGGEMQRTAIARALIACPRLLLADEPTGNLDRQTGQGVMDVLRALNEKENITILIVTHNDEIAKIADQTIRMTEGRIQNA